MHAHPGQATKLSGPTIRLLSPDDLASVVELDALLTGASKREYWERLIGNYLRDEGRIGLAAMAGDELEGYLFAEQRAFEFGSEKCGWIFAVGVQPDTARRGVASALLSDARRRFAEMGIGKVRTMVRRTDVPFLALFRSQGFVGGPFVQLELDITDDPSGLAEPRSFDSEKRS